MVLRLWVPLSHWLWARNWNRAASGAALTASRVANRVAVSTPLRFDALIVLVIKVLLLGGVPLWRGGVMRWRAGARRRVPAVAGSPIRWPRRRGRGRASSAARRTAQVAGSWPA